MKYYRSTANPECSMNQTLYKIDIEAKRYKTTILRKKSNRRFFLIYGSSKCPNFVYNKNI